MEKTKVKNLAKQIRGVSYKPEDLHVSLDDDSVILLRANNIDAGRINFDDVVYVDKSKVTDEQYLRRGDVLICASSGSKQLVGKAASVDFDSPCTFGAFCKVVRPNVEVADYLGVFFQSSAYRRKISEVAIGVNINNIRNEHIDSLELSTYDPKDYIEIVKKIRLVQRIIENRREELYKLDNLIKARFVELFGDPECGEAKYSTKKLEDLSNKISDGVHAKPVYTESGRPFLSVVNINKGIVDFTDCKYVSEDAYQKMIKSTNPEKGDVLYTKVGATYGIPAYVDTEVEFCLYVSVCLIKPKHEAINSRFLSIQMGMPSVKHQADARIKGIGVPDLHLNQIREFDIICPPRELQDKFVAFVEQVDKSKVAVQKSLDETQKLFDSLMQEYFG